MADMEQKLRLTARTELHPFETTTLTDKAFLTGAAGIPARIAGELRLPGDLERASCTRSASQRLSSIALPAAASWRPSPTRRGSALSR
jgi:hypothetical protein